MVCARNGGLNGFEQLSLVLQNKLEHIHKPLVQMPVLAGVSVLALGSKKVQSDESFMASEGQGDTQRLNLAMASTFEAPFIGTLDLLFQSRRDVRSFRSDPVDPGLFEQCLLAAHQAPSVGLSQPWRFLRIRSQHARQAVIESYERVQAAASATYDTVKSQQYNALKLSGLRDAPEHLLVCVDRNPSQGHGLGRSILQSTLRDSAVCAIQNFWLAARCRGIGVGWVSILEPEQLRAPLQLLPEWEWVAYLCIGFPTEFFESPELEKREWEKRRPLSEVVAFR